MLGEHSSTNISRYLRMDNQYMISKYPFVDWRCRYGQEYNCDNGSWDMPAKWVFWFSSILSQREVWSVYCSPNICIQPSKIPTMCCEIHWHVSTRMWGPEPGDVEKLIRYSLTQTIILHLFRDQPFYPHRLRCNQWMWSSPDPSCPYERPTRWYPIPLSCFDFLKQEDRKKIFSL